MLATAMATPAPLCPDKRGGRRTLCHGTFLVMRSGVGWIRPIEEINHPSCRWNKGNVYLADDDVRRGCTLEAGDSVVFYLYVDGKGLGAEDCTQVWNRSATQLEPAITASMTSNFSVNLSSLFFNESDDGDSDTDSVFGGNAYAAPNASIRTPMGKEIRLADALEVVSPAAETDVLDVLLLPSGGSALHAEGMCKRCSFFPKGKCMNGSECEFCHFDHEKRPKRHKRKNKKSNLPEAEEEPEPASSVSAEPARVSIDNEPMKCNPSAFLKSFSKEVYPNAPGSSTPTTIADEGPALSDFASSTCGSPLILENDPCVLGGAFLAPPGLPPPMPGFPPLLSGKGAERAMLPTCFA